jgi:hypothetical protein
MQALAMMLSGLLSGLRPDAQESSWALKVNLIWSVHEVPSSVNFFREIVGYLNISQIMKKSNPYIHSLFKNIAFMQLLFIPFGGFHTPCPSKT